MAKENYYAKYYYKTRGQVRFRVGSLRQWRIYGLIYGRKDPP